MPKTGLTSQQLKERAIECTISRMRKYGFEKVRLSEIAKDLGVTHAALYSHFSDKAALFDAVSERWFVDLDARLEVICTNEEKLSPLECLTQWFLTLHQSKRAKVCNDPELFRAMNFASEIQKPFVRVHLQNMDRQLTSLVKEAIAQKLMRGKPKELVTVLFQATMSFHYPALVANHMNEEREEELQRILNALYKGLA